MDFAFTVANNKGGTGKTTTAVTLAHALAREDRYTLLIDNDPQGHVAASLGEQASEVLGTYELYEENRPLEALVTRSRDHLDTILSDRSLSAAESSLRSRDRYQEVLTKYLSSMAAWDALIVDCSPSLSPLTICAFQLVQALIRSEGAKGGLLVPVKLRALDVEGAVEQEDMLARLDDGWVPPLAGIIPTEYDQRLSVQQEYLRDLREVYGHLVTPPVRTSVRFQEAPTYGQTIFEYDPGGRGSRDYTRIAHYLTEHHD